MKPVTNCPACASADRHPLPQIVTKYVPAHEQLVYCHCSRCGLLYAKNTFTREDKNRAYATIFDRVSMQEFLDDTVSRVKKNRYLVQWLHAQLLRLHRTCASQHALEIGAKDGSFLWLLKQEGWHVVGVDPNRRYGDLARQHYGVDIIDGYFHSETFHQRRFGLVASFGMVEHIENPKPFFASIKTVLQAGGLLYLETPNLRYLQQRQIIGAHPILYSRATLTQLLEHNGFRLLGVTERAPGALMSFDQLAVLAEVDDQPTAHEWQLADDVHSAKRMVDRALSDDFPNPALTLSNHLFHLASRVIGAPAATALKQTVRALQAHGAGRQLAQLRATGATPIAERQLPDPVRQAFHQGEITAGHLQELTRLDDEFAQLHVLARIKAYRLSIDATRALIGDVGSVVS